MPNLSKEILLIWSSAGIVFAAVSLFLAGHFSQEGFKFISKSYFWWFLAGFVVVGMIIPTMVGIMYGATPNLKMTEGILLFLLIACFIWLLATGILPAALIRWVNHWYFRWIMVAVSFAIFVAIVTALVEIFIVFSRKS